MSVRKHRSYDAEFKKNAVLLSTIEDGDIRAMAGFRLPPLSIAMNSMTLWFNLVPHFRCRISRRSFYECISGLLRQFLPKEMQWEKGNARSPYEDAKAAGA